METGALLGQHILGDVIKELAKDTVQGHVVDEFGRVFLVHALDAVDDLVGHVMQVSAVPCLIDFVQKSLRHEVFHLGDALV